MSGIDTEKCPQYRSVTASLLADRTSEDDIKRLLIKWDKGIKGSAYILHDKDTYVASEVKEISKKRDKMIEAIKDNRANYATEEDFEKAIQEQLDSKVTEGQPKPPHWHILLDFGSQKKSVDSIAAYLNCEPNMICKLTDYKKDKGMKAFASMLAYFTHITDAAFEEGKYEYNYSDVKGLKFPDEVTYEDFETYEDFAEAYKKRSLLMGKDCVAVMKGLATPKEIKDRNPYYYLDNINKIHRARLEYLNSMPTPELLFNFYVGAYDSDDGGRIGKGLACQVLAVSHLKNMYPDVNFEDMTIDDLNEKYVFYAGCSKVAFDSYDGQPIVIWEDIRAEDLVSVYNDKIGDMFKALDTHPKPIDVHIKYGKIKLKNSINIFNGILPYHEFIDSLHEIACRAGQKEDKAQAIGRFPFFISVSPDFITSEASMMYLVGHNRHDFKRTVKNNLQAIAQHSRLYRDTDWLGKDYIEAEQKVINLPDKTPLPDSLFEVIDNDVFESYEKFTKRWKYWADRRGKENFKPIGFDEWIELGQPSDYDVWYKEQYGHLPEIGGITIC